MPGADQSVAKVTNMSLDGSDLGRAVEAAVAGLCTASFFPDTVVRSPKYQKKDGQQKGPTNLAAVR